MNLTVRVLARTVKQYDGTIGRFLPSKFINRLLRNNGQKAHPIVSYPLPITYLGVLVWAAHCLISCSLSGATVSYLLRLPQHRVQLSMISSYALKTSGSKASLSSSSSAPPANLR